MPEGKKSPSTRKSSSGLFSGLVISSWLPVLTHWPISASDTSSRHRINSALAGRSGYITLHYIKFIVKKMPKHFSHFADGTKLADNEFITQ